MIEDIEYEDPYKYFTILRPQTIHIKYLPGAPHLEQTSYGSWIDLYVYQDTTLQANEYAQICLGVAMKLPEGYEAIIAPRSSTFKRYGLLETNSIGVIDNSYCGNDDIWAMPCIATKAITIPKGTRLCQFRIQEEQPKINFVEVENLGESRGGFGSSGV